MSQSSKQTSRSDEVKFGLFRHIYKLKGDIIALESRKRVASELFFTPFDACLQNCCGRFFSASRLPIMRWREISIIFPELWTTIAFTRTTEPRYPPDNQRGEFQVLDLALRRSASSRLDIGRLSESYYHRPSTSSTAAAALLASSPWVPLFEGPPSFFRLLPRPVVVTFELAPALKPGQVMHNNPDSDRYDPGFASLLPDVKLPWMTITRYSVETQNKLCPLHLEIPVLCLNLTVLELKGVTKKAVDGIPGVITLPRHHQLAVGACDSGDVGRLLDKLGLPALTSLQLAFKS
ncbi:hypothetical protein C8J56DRAFT_1058470 [Mycena floridula]|nr:hypothetical protein C8J56DRAFT_1058470 [Mycena floridula]